MKLSKDQNVLIDDDGTVYIAEDAYYNCEGCVFKEIGIKCVDDASICLRRSRKDKRSIIWVKDEDHVHVSG